MTILIMFVVFVGIIAWAIYDDSEDEMTELGASHEVYQEAVLELASAPNVMVEKRVEAKRRLK